MNRLCMFYYSMEIVSFLFIGLLFWEAVKWEIKYLGKSRNLWILAKRYLACLGILFFFGCGMYIFLFVIKQFLMEV